MNKKQKKQLDVARKKLGHLQQLRTAARKQPDDPREVAALDRQIKELEAEIEKLKNG